MKRASTRRPGVLALFVILVLASSPAQGRGAGGTVPGPVWSDREKLSLELSFISMAGCWETDPIEIGRTISSLVERMLPSEEIVWGPAVHQPNPDFPGAKLSDALAFICRNRDSGDFTVVFRGTNTISASEWILQDFLVRKTVPWLQIQEGPAPLDARVSEGTANAVALRRALVPIEGGAGGDLGLTEALVGILESSEGVCGFHFTGHSLGGLLAPVMALWLVDYLESSGRGDLLERLRLDVYGYAAPTAGNKAFAAYLDSRIASNQRYANELDAATKVWSWDTMEDIPGLYGPSVGMQGVALALYRLSRGLARQNGYAHPGHLVRVPARIVPAPGGLFLLEAAYQHSIPYLDILDPSRKAVILREVIDPLSAQVQLGKLSHEQVRDFFDPPPLPPSPAPGS